MLVLGIESSCDETAAAVVEDGARVLSDVISSQVALHARYGGVVPEVASRQHLLQIVPVLEGALAEAEVTLDDIDAVAVTHGPGLMGSLMVGVNTAKALAYARGLPLVGVHHLEGHTYAAWLGGTDPEVDPGFPLIVLIASGAHTDLILMRGHGDYEFLGRTRDDAAGEAFDKAARIMGLGYPGGPAIQRIAEGNLEELQLLPHLVGSELTISLDDGATVHGVVADAEGEPIPGAVVLPRERRIDLLRIIRLMRTDPVGHFELGGLAPGPARLLAHAEGYETAEAELILAAEANTWYPRLRALPRIHGVGRA